MVQIVEERGRVPLLEAAASSSPSGGRRRAGEAHLAGGATAAQTLGNIVVSIVGTGVLGLPYAFRVAGWLAGALGVAAAGLATLYCMLLLVQCRQKLQENEETNGMHFQTYGDLGAKAFGSVGRYMTECLILVAQTGGSIAYLVFIGQNLASVFAATQLDEQYIRPAAVFIFLLLLPVEVALSFIRSLSTLAPFSAFADICNVLAMAIVIKEDLQIFDDSKNRSAFNGIWGLPFASGVAVFCFEGFSMTLALEASMAERRKFPWVLLQAFVGITVAYICFGIFGYLAYGNETKDIITLNLPDNWTAVAVKVGLCIALAFTFPIMMHPINEIVETRLKSNKWFQNLSYNTRAAEWFGLHLSRILVLVLLSLLASFVPGFGNFVSFVGSTVCALLSFVLPAMFHLTFLGSEMKLWQRILDYGILLIGTAFAAHGVYDAISGHSSK